MVSNGRKINRFCLMHCIVVIIEMSGWLPLTWLLNVFRFFINGCLLKQLILLHACCNTHQVFAVQRWVSSVSLFWWALGCKCFDLRLLVLEHMHNSSIIDMAPPDNGVLSYNHPNLMLMKSALCYYSLKHAHIPSLMSFENLMLAYQMGGRYRHFSTLNRKYVSELNFIPMYSPFYRKIYLHWILWDYFLARILFLLEVKALLLICIFLVTVRSCETANRATTFHASSWDIKL